MRKIRLDLEQLSVDSFTTAASSAAGGGTVHARESTQMGVNTCGFSCQISCLNRCSRDGTCDVPVCMW